MATNSLITRTRRIGARDGPTLRSLHLAALTDGSPAFTQTVAQLLAQLPASFIQTALEQRASKTATTFFLDIAGQPVGLAGAAVSPESLPRGFIHSLWVAPEHRRAAPALISATAKWLFTSPLVDEVAIWIDLCDNATIALFQRLGFRPESAIQTQPIPPTPTDQLYSVTRPALRQKIL